MGPTERDVAWALAGMIPPGGSLFTADERHGDVFRQAAQDRGSRLVMVSRGRGGRRHRGGTGRLFLHRACRKRGLGIGGVRGAGHRSPHGAGGHVAARRPTLARWPSGIARRTESSSGWPTDLQPTIRNRARKFGISCCGGFPQAGRRIALFNCRADRPERSWRLGQACAAWQAADHYVVVGGGVHHFARAAGEAGLDMRRVVLPRGRTAEEILETRSANWPTGPRWSSDWATLAGWDSNWSRLFQSRGTRANGPGSTVCIPPAREMESDSWNC